MIEFHADDYGMFPEAAKRIIACIEHGCVNGISIMPNAPCFEECMEILKRECQKQVAMSVHLNLMTGKPLSDRAEIPDLVGDDGNFCLTYGKLLLGSVLPGQRKRYQKQIETELTRQIERCLPYYPEGSGIRLDSHRHFHMVPVVFDAIAELIRKNGYALDDIRIIREKPSFYKRIWKAEHFRPVNIIKVWLLNLLGSVDRRRQRALYERHSADFASILFSGCMTEGNLSWMLENIQKNRGAFSEKIELMFHPGYVSKQEDLERISDPEDRRYMNDPMRCREYDALMKHDGSGKTA